jgi:hypothetical protein
MRPGDVTDEIMQCTAPGVWNGEQRLPHDEEGAALLAWGALVGHLKPDDQRSEMTPDEIEKVKRIAVWLADAIDRASRRPSAPLPPAAPHLRVV